METFLAVLQSLSASGLQPTQAAIHTTANGPGTHEMMITFRPEDQASADDTFDELARLGLDPQRKGEGLVITAVVGTNDIAGH